MDPVRYIFAIIVVAAALAGSIYLLRRFKLTNSEKHFKISIIGHLSLGTRERLLVVRFGEEDILLGVTAQSITRIAATPILASGTADKDR